MSARRLSGLVLLIGGGLIVLSASARYVEGALTQDEARATWESRSAHSAVAAAWASVEPRTRAPLPPGAPVARLIIPRIGLDEIVLEGVDDDALNGGPGHFPGTPLPGERGNAVISAHRDRHFRKLGEVRIGDTLRTESSAGASAWLVVGRRLVDKDARAIHPADGRVLTLTTCWPIRYFGPAPERLILTAKPLD